MWVYDNDTVSDTFIVDLTEDRDVQDNLPCNFLSVRNDSSLVAFVYLDNKRVGAVQAYSSDPFIGKNFEIIMIKQPDGDNFAIGDLFLQVGKNEQMSSTPYNPSWDLMEENIDVYASGCDSRISLSAVNTVDRIKYWINTQNNKIVQRRLSVQGSASLGTYAITFDPETIISGGVPINGEVLDTKQYKKVITNSEFDYAITNATIQGWMIDYLISTDIIDSSTITDSARTTPYGDSIQSYDNIMSTFGGTFHSLNTNYTTIMEFVFTEQLITTFNLYIQVRNTAGYTNTWNVEYYDTSWHELYNDTTTSSTLVSKFKNIAINKTISKIRIRMKTSVGSGESRMQIHDITII